jgi:hypothetical protein
MEIQPLFSHEWSSEALNAFLSTALAGDDVRELEVVFHALHE